MLPLRHQSGGFKINPISTIVDESKRYNPVVLGTGYHNNQPDSARRYYDELYVLGFSPIEDNELDIEHGSSDSEQDHLMQHEEFPDGERRRARKKRQLNALYDAIHRDMHRAEGARHEYVPPHLDDRVVMFPHEWNEDRVRYDPIER